MAKKKRKDFSRNSKKRYDFDIMEQIKPNAAGIDIGSEAHYVAVPRGRDAKCVHRFEAFTADLHRLVAFLKECRIDTVAMEATGVYWIPLFEILEVNGFEVILVNARHIKTVPGRKTDVLDCQWIQQLHSYGLLKASFRPDHDMRILRNYWRHRKNLIEYRSSHILHIQKSLDEMNVKLHNVIADITGKTGMMILKAILDGERDTVKLAQMKDRRIKKNESEIAKSLEGNWRDDHLFSLRQAIELYDVFNQKLEECDREIEQYMISFEMKHDLNDIVVPKPRKKKKKSGNAPKFSLRNHLYKICGVDLTSIDGINEMTAQTVVSELGTDMSKFPTEKHCASWMGLSPGSFKTGDKVKKGKTRKVVNRAATALRVAAMSLIRSNTALGAYYRRMRSRLGASKAITAAAHKFVCIIYNMLKTKREYVDLGAEHYNARFKERQVRNLKKNARRLGFEIVEAPVG